jgi:hypothetical protein
LGKQINRKFKKKKKQKHYLTPGAKAHQPSPSRRLVFFLPAPRSSSVAAEHTPSATATSWLF